jgi:hypothetical protein
MFETTVAVQITVNVRWRKGAHAAVAAAGRGRVVGGSFGVGALISVTRGRLEPNANPERPSTVRFLIHSAGRVETDRLTQDHMRPRPVGAAIAIRLATDTLQGVPPTAGLSHHSVQAVEFGLSG